MALPPRPFVPLAEVASCWKVSAEEIVSWSIDRMIDLAVVLPLVETSAGLNASGFNLVAGEDVFGLVREGGTRVDAVTICRFRRSRPSDWEMIASPPEGVPVRADDLGVLSSELVRVGQMWDVLIPRGDLTPGPKPYKPGPGANPKYDWDRFAGAVAVLIHEHGKPRSQRELARLMHGWFERIYGSAPDERTVEKKVRAMWVEISACDDEPVVFGKQASAHALGQLDRAKDDTDPGRKVSQR